MTTGPMMYGANNDAGNTETYLVCTSLAQTLAVQNRNPDSSSIIVSGTRTGLWGHTTDAGQLPEFRAGVRGSAVLTVGVLGHSGTGKGVWGQVIGDSGSAVAVHGEAQGLNSNGVKGEAHNGSGAYGVWGRSTSGYAGVFGGRVSIYGTLWTSGKAFRIDHPLDPENRYLSHSSVESDVMLNVYGGRVQTDAGGNAVVSLPTYFEALNEDFRYQLTVMREFAQAIVAEEVHDNRFTIRTDRPNVTVCWQVTGVRKDPYAQRNPIVVEEDKPEEHRGTYLHPEVYGQPESRYIDYKRIKGIKDVQPGLPKDWTPPTELRPPKSE